MTTKTWPRRLLDYLLSFAIILIALGIGNFISKILPFAFPGSILGMLLLFSLLNLGIIKLHWIDASGALLLRHMALLFIPVAVSLLDHMDTVLSSLGVILVNMALGIILILLLVGRLFQWMNKA